MQDWGGILQAAVIPFLEANKNAFHSFYITLNSTPGEHLRLSLVTDKDNCTAISSAAADWFNTSFQMARDFKAPPVVYVDESEPLAYDNIPMAAVDGFYGQTTTILLKTLAGMNITDETLLTYACYLHLALIGSLAARFNKAPLFFSPLYDPASLSSHPDTSLVNELIVLKFEENSAFILETAGILLSGTQPDNIPEFITAWLKAVSAEIDKLLPDKNGHLLSTMHRYFALSINRQLGITVNMRALLYYFIYRGITETHEAALL
jgi:hypothetical protein